MSRFFAFATFVVGGMIVANLVIHGSQTTQVLGGLTSLEGNVGNQLLGSPSKAA